MLKQSKRVTIKRVLAAFLAIVMCFGMLPDSFGGAVATVYAATENEVTYSFKDGDVIGEYGSENPLTGGATVSSADGVVTLVGNNKMYHHGASHGITFGKNDAIKVKVAGDATIKLEACKYTNGQTTGSAIVVTGLADGASVTPEEADF
ncbi:MAG: hypothetical protein J6B39_00770, partial [Lachnospiraceae bacterium]|nr:hypothetical protein [Lachnospiraceae bacterium]